MTNYRRAYVPGASWFFTLNFAERKDNHLLIDNIDVLCTGFRYVKARHPFRIDAVVVLPDHMHCIWTLPPGDADFSTRWNLVKSHFSRAMEKGERISDSAALEIRSSMGPHSSFHTFVEAGAYSLHWGCPSITGIHAGE